MEAVNRILLPSGPWANPKTFFELASLQITEADGEGIRSVRRLRRLLHMEQGADHHLHLAFISMPIAGYAGFNFAGRIAANLDVMLLRGEEDYAANFGQTEGRSHI